MNLHEMDLDERHAIENHDAILAATKLPPQIVHKTMMNSKVQQSAEGNGDIPIDSDLLEALAEALAENAIQLRNDCQAMIDAAVAPLRERITVLEAQMAMLTALLGNGGTRMLEASETETVRKLRVTK